jgi:ribosomal RNA-processing protein 12
VLTAVEDTLKEQNSELTPAAYFAALLALLKQHNPGGQLAVEEEIAPAVLYLLDLILPEVSIPLLRTKFSQLATSFAPVLSARNAGAPIIRSCIGCFESLLLAQDAQAWSLPHTQIGPRAGVQALLQIAMDPRPKVRKRSQEAIGKILQNPPPGPALNHPAAEMCAAAALEDLSVASIDKNRFTNNAGVGSQQTEANVAHALQLVKTVAGASGGWPSRKIDELCELLLRISRSSNEFLTMAAFQVFENIFIGMIDDDTSPKLSRVLEIISELKPSKTDAQLMPSWLAVISRGYDVAAQVEPEQTFEKLPALFVMVSNILDSPAHDVRVSASECLISFLVNLIPSSVLVNPSVFDEKILERLSKSITSLLDIRFQAAWMEVFTVLGAAFDALRWHSWPQLSSVVKQVGELRSNDAFTNKSNADIILSKAIRAMGPDKVLEILPLNLLKPIKGQAGRAWLLPLLRDSVSNTYLSHFRSQLIPLSEVMFQRILDHGAAEKTMEVKIYETVVNQVWAALPGYCDLPLDLKKVNITT